MSACAQQCYYCGQLKTVITVCGVCLTHREPATDVSDEEECVVLEVARHGVAAAQLCGPAIPLVVVADGAVTNHGQN